MISYRSRKHKIPTMTPFRLALSDAVLSYLGPCPWAEGTENYRIYMRTKTAALLSTTENARPFSHYLLHHHGRGAGCEDCNLEHTADLICSLCGTLLCPSCDMLHECSQP